MFDVGQSGLGGHRPIACYPWRWPLKHAVDKVHYLYVLCKELMAWPFKRTGERHKRQDVEANVNEVWSRQSTPTSTPCESTLLRISTLPLFLSINIDGQRMGDVLIITGEKKETERGESAQVLHVDCTPRYYAA